MLVLVVATLLAAIAVAAFPCWPYSARWGYIPSVIAGALLLSVATLVIGSKSAPKAADASIAGLPAHQATGARDAFPRRTVTVSIEPENASQ